MGQSGSASKQESRAAISRRVAVLAVLAAPSMLPAYFNAASHSHSDYDGGIRPKKKKNTAALKFYMIFMKIFKYIFKSCPCADCHTSLLFTFQ